MSTEALHVAEHEKASIGSNFRRTRRVLWDISVVDRVLYFLNPLILIVTGMCLLLTLSLIQEPDKSISCIFPAQFTTEWCLYGETVCMSRNAHLALVPEVGSDESQLFENKSNLLDPENLFPMDHTYEPQIFPSQLFLMAALSTLPYLCWRSIAGTRDACEVITGSNINILTLMWFVITKIGATILSAVFLVMITMLRVKGQHFIETIAQNGAPKDMSVICQYFIIYVDYRRVENLVLCSISQKANYPDVGVVISSLLTATELWIICLLGITTLNLIVSAIIAFRCQGRHYRRSFIQQYVQDTESDACSQLEQRLQSGEILVLNLACRSGYGTEVADALNHFLRNTSREMTIVDGAMSLTDAV